MHHKLYGTFIHPNELEQAILKIRESTTIVSNRILEFVCIGKDENLLTYNVDNTEYVNSDRRPNNLVLHRQGTCLYSVNALNLIVNQSGHYKVDWDKYANTLLTTKRGDIAITKTELKKVHYF